MLKAKEKKRDNLFAFIIHTKSKTLVSSSMEIKNALGSKGCPLTSQEKSGIVMARSIALFRLALRKKPNNKNNRIGSR